MRPRFQQRSDASGRLAVAAPGRRRSRSRPAGSSRAPRAGTRSSPAPAPGGSATVRLADRGARSGSRPGTRRRHRTRTRRRPRRTSAAPSAPIAGPEQQPAHLHRAVQPERLASPLRRRRIGQVAARGRVVERGRQPGPGAQQDERQRPGEDERQRGEHPGRDQPDDHQRHARRPVGQPAEDRLAHEPGRRPRRDDEAEQSRGRRPAR